MSDHHVQNQPPATYPPLPPTAPSEGNTPGSNVAPPPAGFPMRDDNGCNPPPPVQTKARGDGFLEGCCAALCCCCLLDMCF